VKKPYLPQYQVETLSPREKVRQRPFQFFMPSPQNRLDAFNLHREFLCMALAGACLTLPKSIHISSHDEHHTAIAFGSRLLVESILNQPISRTLEGYSSFIDWLYYQVEKSYQGPDSPIMLLPVSRLGHLVYACEFFLLDITTEEEHIQQLFFRGEPASFCVRRKANDFPQMAPFISMRCTADASIFHSRTVTLEQIKSALATQTPTQWLPEETWVESETKFENGFEMVIKSKKPFSPVFGSVN